MFPEVPDLTCSWEHYLFGWIGCGVRVWQDISDLSGPQDNKTKRTNNTCSLLGIQLNASLQLILAQPPLDWLDLHRKRSFPILLASILEDLMITERAFLIHRRAYVKAKLSENLLQQIRYKKTNITWARAWARSRGAVDRKYLWFSNEFTTLSNHSGSCVCPHMDKEGFFYYDYYSGLQNAWPKIQTAPKSSDK